MTRTRGDTLYRGRLFKICAEIVGTRRGGTVELGMGRVARPLGRRSWTEEAAREALPYLAEHPGTTAAGPDGTLDVFARAAKAIEHTGDARIRQ